ncbi:MAG: dUTP diphosphatase [Stutzerimonas stutzeri]|nr:MAG: dUTP diphosphatase [Stutzerimonas stutzeri]
MPPTVKMRRLSDELLGAPGRSGLPLPQYQTAGAAAFDLAAALAEDEIVTVLPHQVQSIHTGFSMEIPVGYEGQIRARSGLSKNHKIIPINGPGTVDSDFSGPVQVLLYNAGLEPFAVTRGMRIAQMVIAPAEQAIIEEAFDAPPSTLRGAGGFGSTGL